MRDGEDLRQVPVSDVAAVRAILINAAKERRATGYVEALDALGHRFTRSATGSGPVNALKPGHGRGSREEMDTDTMIVSLGGVGGSVMMRKLMSGLVVACLFAGMVGVASAGWDPANEQRALDTIAAFKKTDPSIDTFFNKAHGYVVFPEITKGAIGIGGAAGDGTVFERGTAIGSSSVTQVTIGLQLGGQTYSEVILFKDKAALDNFKRGDYEVAAGASAVALKEGVSKTADYQNGIAIFTMGTGGLMFEASIGGQKFSFEPK